MNTEKHFWYETSDGYFIFNTRENARGNDAPLAVVAKAGTRWLLYIHPAEGPVQRSFYDTLEGAKLGAAIILSALS